MEIDELAVKITGDSTSLQAAMNQATDAMGKLGIGTSTLTGLLGAAGLTAAFTLAYNAASKMVQAYRDDETAQLKYNAALAASAVITAQGKKALDEYVPVFASLSGIAEADTQAQIARLAAYGRTDAQIKTMMQTALGMSTVLDMDVNTALTQLNMTFSGTIGRLGQQIPAMKDLTAEQLKNGEGIKLLNGKYGEFAGTLKDSTDISIKNFENAWSDLMSTMGASIAGTIKPVRDAMTGLFRDIIAQTQNSNSALEIFATGFNNFVNIFKQAGLSIIGKGNIFAAIDEAVNHTEQKIRDLLVLYAGLEDPIQKKARLEKEAAERTRQEAEKAAAEAKARQDKITADRDKATKDYETQLETIDRQEKLGILTKEEAADARKAALKAEVDALNDIILKYSLSTGETIRLRNEAEKLYAGIIVGQAKVAEGEKASKEAVAMATVAEADRAEAVQMANADIARDTKEITALVVAGWKAANDDIVAAAKIAADDGVEDAKEAAKLALDGYLAAEDDRIEGVKIANADRIESDKEAAREALAMYRAADEDRAAGVEIANKDEAEASKEAAKESVAWWIAAEEDRLAAVKIANDDSVRDGEEAARLALDGWKAAEDDRLAAVKMANDQDEQDAKNTALAVVEGWKAAEEDRVAANKMANDEIAQAAKKFADDAKAGWLIAEEERQAAVGAGVEVTKRQYEESRKIAHRFFGLFSDMASGLSSLISAQADNAVAAVEDRLDALKKSYGSTASELQTMYDALEKMGATEKAATIKAQLDKEKAVEDYTSLSMEQLASLYATAMEMGDTQTAAEVTAAMARVKAEKDAADEIKQIKYDAAVAEWNIKLMATTASAAQAVMDAYSSLISIPIVGPTLAPIAAGVAAGVGIVQIAAVSEAKPKLDTGGVVRARDDTSVTVGRGTGEVLLGTSALGDPLVNGIADKIAARIGGQPIVVRLVCDGKTLAEVTAQQFNNGQVRLKR